MTLPAGLDSTPRNQRLQAALEYAARRFQVYPAIPGTKVPTGPWGAGATTDPLELLDHWGRTPGANILMACGACSGVTVLDFDVKVDKATGAPLPGEQAARHLLGDGWKSRHCYTTTPSGGYHVWCPYEPAWGNTKRVPGLDVQGDGAYVIVPPSVLVAGQCGERDVPGPYLVVNPHLPLVSVLDAESHARVTNRVGAAVAAPGPTQAADMPAGWQALECPPWREVLPRLSPRVRAYLETEDPGQWVGRSEAVMAVTTNLLALKVEGGVGWWLLPAQVLNLLAQVGHVTTYAEEHAGGASRGPWWLWRYNVVPARDSVRRPVFEGVVSAAGGAGAAVSLADATQGLGATQVAEVLPAGEPDPLAQALAHIATLTPPYDDAVRHVCHAVAEHGFDELAQARVLDVLAEHTGHQRALLKRQLAGEIKAVTRERRDVAKRAPGSVLDTYVMVEQTGCLWKLSEPGWVTLTAFRAMWGADASAAALEPVGGVRRCGRATYRPAAQWAPGFDREAARWHVNEDTQQRELNLWEPSPLVPAVGVTDEDVAPWLRHMDETLQVPAADQGHVLDWCAATVARPHEKINHMLLLGGGQETGKDSFLAPVIAGVGASNALITKGDSLLGDHDPERLGHASFMLLEELATGGRADAQRAYNNLKTYISAPPDEICIDIKHVRQYFIPNIVNVAAVTNSRQPLTIEQDDRRAFMVWCRGRAGNIPESYFADLWAWYRTGGLELVVGWLLARDLGRWNGKARPPVTGWREQAQDDSLHDVAQVVRDVIADGEGPGAWEVVRAVDLLPSVRLRMLGVPKPPTARQVTLALGELGYASRRVNPLMTDGNRGSKATFWLLRNEKCWLTESTPLFWDAVK